MLNKMQGWVKKKLFKNRFEVLLPILTLVFTIMCLQGEALASWENDKVQDILEAAVTGTEITGEVPFADNEVIAAIGDAKTEEAENAGDSGSSTTAYRIIPLQQQLSQMSTDVIGNYLNRFTDMGKHWSRQTVGKLTGLDIIAGANGKFLPDAPLQADQFIKMCVRAMGYKIEQGTGYWAQPYIDMALKEGLVVKGEIADYKKPLSREHMARIIVRTTLKVDAKPDSKYDQYIMGKVNDYSDIADGLKQFVLDAYKLGLITGANNKFMPKGTLTRAEAAAVIIRFLDVTERKPMQPGEGEVIRLVDNLGNPMEIYLGTIKEYFEIEKVMEKALPKAKGYAPFFYSPETGAVITCAYKNYEAWQQSSTVNKIAKFQSTNTHNDPDNPFAYTLSVWDKGLYNELFADYIREILKAIYGKDANKAIELHDKYLNLNSDKPDGSNYYEATRINDRYTELVGNSSGFSFFVKLKGEK